MNFKAGSTRSSSRWRHGTLRELETRHEQTLVQLQVELDRDIDLQSVPALKTRVDKLRPALRAYLEAATALMNRHNAGGAASASKESSKGITKWTGGSGKS